MIRSLQQPSQSTAGPADGSHSGEPARPIDGIRRSAVDAASARTELEAFKLSMRRHDPLVHGLPWPCQAHCVQCDATVPAEFVLDPGEQAVYLATRCPTCGPRRELHHDAIFTAPKQDVPTGQPATTRTGHPVRPVLRYLPRTVETLCPECGCVLLGRYYVKGRAVLIEKTCPDHGYFRDTINTEVDLYLKGARSTFQDERGVCEPQVTGAKRCPTDCGLCNQHLSASCLAQIDLSNRCNLTCPVCFANANTSGYVSEPDFAMVAEMLAALRAQQPYPATAIQFTGGEPTIHPEFFRIVRHAHASGFSHIQIATNGIKMAEPAFAEQAAEAGLHTLYLQFDGVGDEFYRKSRGQALMDKKLACVENCQRTGLKIVLVPTIIKGFNDDQVDDIFRFAVEHIDAISAISYQPVAFTGRINRRDLAAQRYTLGDLARDVAAASGADLDRDFWPLGMLTPLSRIMECLDGKSKIRASCHSDCAFGTYFFVTPDRQTIPIPRLFDMYGMMDDFNRQAAGIQGRRRSPEEIVKASTGELIRIAWTFLRRYRWSQFFKTDIKPWTFIRALQGLTNKAKGRGAGEKKSYKTLMAAGMHFMDRYNYDCERVRRCVIQYSTPDGIYPFCTINGGPTYRPFIEKIQACSKDEYARRVSNAERAGQLSERAGPSSAPANPAPEVASDGL